jgi:2-dehydropantoate 2-reductase
MSQVTPTNPRLRFLVFGAGAIGTYIGGSLALHGYPCVFLERPDVATRVRQTGLKLKIKEQELTLSKPTLADTLEEALAAGPFDAAIFALKSFDTPGAVEQLAPHAAALPPILCLSNGLANEEALAAALGADKVIAGTVTSAIGRRGPGDIVLEKLRGMGLHSAHPLSAALHQALADAGLNPRLYASAADMKWSKMLTNLLANATSAILDMTPIQIFEHPGLYRLELEQMREALHVMDTLGIHVVDLPATPVRALAFAIRSLPAAISRPVLKNAVGSGRGAKMPSFHIDLHSGRGQSEVDYLNGAVVRHGAQAGIPTPVNRLLNETLLALTDGSLPPASFAGQPQKLLKLAAEKGR